MKLFSLEKPPAQSFYPKLTAAEQWSLWMRVGMSIIGVGLTLVLVVSLIDIIGSGIFLVFIAGLALSLVLPHWRFRHQAHIKTSLILSAIYFVVTFLVVVLQSFFFNAPPELLMLSILFIGLALSLILPHFRYREGIYSLLILIVWFILTSIAMPSLIKKYYLFTDAKAYSVVSSALVY